MDSMILTGPFQLFYDSMTFITNKASDTLSRFPWLWTSSSSYWCLHSSSNAANSLDKQEVVCLDHLLWIFDLCNLHCV